MSEATPYLLFVCVENSCRSQMAEGFARALGKTQVSTFSAGSKPSGQVNPRAIQFMRERGIDLTRQHSKGLDDLPAGTKWDYIVTMGCGDACPSLPAHHRIDWDLPDPKYLSDEEFRVVRDRVESLVAKLIDDAAGSSDSGKEPGR